MSRAADLAQSALLNRHCHCSTTDIRAVREWTEQELARHGVHEPLVSTHPHLFSEFPVFVEQADIDATAAVIAAVESVVLLPDYREAVLASAPPIARIDNGSHGLFLSYDFHLSPDGPRLIEINTNPGGSLLNALLLRAQIACCPETLRLPASLQPDQIEPTLHEIFRHEWTLARQSSSRIQRVAIVDEAPLTQFLYPEFLLFKKLFEAHGCEAVIVDPGALQLHGTQLEHDGRVIDMVYNRLTDFYLERSEHEHLSEAHRSNAVVMTPHPHAHALYANKHNLALLSDERELLRLGVPPAAIDVLLKHIPRTQAVSSRARDEWWAERKDWFFKPSSGYAARGAYRGDKMTRKVFADVMDGDYVAQSIVPPNVRHYAAGTEPLRWDLRVYAYGGKPLLHAARLYAGQTTNLRTPGGGFAPVFVSFAPSP